MKKLFIFVLLLFTPVLFAAERNVVCEIFTFDPNC
jgi:hypothetical protein